MPPSPTPNTNTRPRARRTSVLLAGASGLVGHELLRQLLARSPQPTVHALVRRPIEPADGRVRWLTVDFAALPKLPAADEAWCCLGTTIKQAGSQAAFRAVDFAAVLAFAKASRVAGAQRFGVVSAMGADARSAVFYNRVKGEMEAAVAALGFAQVVIARPSLLVGDRAARGQPVRAGEALALRLSTPLALLVPRSVRPIAASTVARGMLEAMRESRPGVRVVASGELQTLGAAP